MRTADRRFRIILDDFTLKSPTNIFPRISGCYLNEKGAVATVAVGCTQVLAIYVMQNALIIPIY